MHVRESQPQMLVWVRSVLTLVSLPQNHACNSAFCVAAMQRARAQARARKTTDASLGRPGDHAREYTVESRG